MGQAGKARQSWQDYQRQWQEAFGLEPSPAMVALSAELDAAGDKAAQTPGVSVEAPGMTAPSPDSEPAALLDDHRQFARIATQLGLFHQGRFANAAALEYLTLALHSLDELPSTPEVQRQALALRFRCDELYDLLAKRDLQMENLTEAWKVADALGDAPTKAEVLARQIWLYRALGDLSSVSGHVQQAVALLPEIPSSQQALIHRLAGMVAEHAGDLLAAHRSYTQALTLDEADQNREAALADLINLMGVCTSMGYYARALTLSAQAEEILPICSNLHLETVLQGMQGRLWLQLGDFSTARQLTSQALRAARRAGYVQIELWLTWVRAALYQAQGNHQHALLIATHAYRRAQEMRLPRESVLLADLVADLHLSLEQPDLALAWVDGLAEQAAHSGYQAYMLRADWHRCRALLALGKIPEALTLACQLIETYQARAQPLEEAPSLFRTLSSCAHIAGDMIQAEWAEQQSQQALLGMAKDLPAAGLRDRFLQMWGNERRQVMPGSQ
jgi:tetratricopeptide (TPR) repeat protein